MATYTESAWGSTDATYPTSVLTKRWVTTNETTVAANALTEATSGYTFEQDWSVAGRRLNSLDAVDSDINRDDAEVMIRFRVTETLVDYPVGIVVRGSGSAGSENGYILQFLEYGSQDMQILIAKYVSGTASTLVSTAGEVYYDFATNTWGYLRFRVNGSTLQAKMWNESSREPENWLISTTDTDITAAGWIGLWGFAANQNVDVDWISVGTDGDAAPYVADTTATTRITHNQAQVLHSGANPTARVTHNQVQVLYKAAPPTYIETQWGSSAGTFPSSILTKRWHTANETTAAAAASSVAEDGYVFNAEWSASARRFISWDALDGDADRDDIELLARFQLEGTSRIDLEFGLGVRGSGTDTTETGYVVYLDELFSNDIRLVLGEFSSGTFSNVQTGTSRTFAKRFQDGWWYLRFRANGTSLKARMWKDGYEAEPSTWDIDATDSTHTAAGWNGFYCGAANKLFTVDYLSAGTAGASAPLRVDTDNPYRLTTAQLHALHRDASPPVRLTTAQLHALHRDASPPVRLTTAQLHVLYVIQTQDVRLTQQVAELAVQQNLANIEARSTQQIVEVLVQFRGQVTQQIAELAVQQNLANVEVRSTHQVIEILGKVLSYQVSQQVAELAVQQNLANIEARSTQQIVEVLLDVIGSRVTQQVAELAVYQNLANIEVRSTQQVVEVLVESIPNPQVTQQVAELAVYQNLANVEVRSTQQIVELIFETINYGRVSQQVAELAVYQNLANIEVRSTQQLVEVLFFTGLEKVIIVTQSVAETAVRQNADHVDVSSTHQIVEVLINVVDLAGPAYDNFDAQPISIMV